MSYLRCSAMTCANNRNNLCVLNEIHVDGDHAQYKNETCCDSFTQRAENYSNVIERNSGAEPGTNVACDACNCTYNERHQCVAPSVDISGSHACSTFDCKGCN